jgi:hypothetical protein
VLVELHQRRRELQELNRSAGDHGPQPYRSPGVRRRPSRYRLRRYTRVP